jgi:hypothetical protein
LNIGRVKADNVISAFTRTGFAIPILELSAFLYFFAHTLTGRVVGPFVVMTSAFPDLVALATAIYCVVIGSSGTFEALKIWIGTKIDYLILNWCTTLHKIDITIRRGF